jgi:predicted MPP superfamily phosphohydrolase
MIAELYDKTVFLIVLSTMFSALMIYPALGAALTVAYAVWGFSFILTASLDSAFNNGIIRFLYTASFLGVGFTAILAPLLVAFTLLDWLLLQYVGLTYSSSTAIAAVTLAIILAVWGFVKSFYVYTRRVDLEVGRDEPIHIAHISDLHVGATLGRQRLKQVVSTIKDIQPDLTVLTGDLLDGSGWPQKGSLKPLERLDTVLASLGNHDYYYGENTMERLEEAGITCLRNQAVVESGLYVAGVDDKEYPDQIPAQEITTFNPPGDQTSVLLYHRPEEVDIFKDSSFDVMLSGHTHNGQILPLKWLASFVYTYLYGVYVFDDKYLNVSSGAGTGGPMMRLGTNNEVCHIVLQ